MEVLLNDLVVGLVLLASVLYAVFSLGPRRLRARMLAATAAALRELPGFLGVGGLAQRLQTAASIQAAGACGGCGTCGRGQRAAPESRAAGAPDSGGPARSPETTSVPVSKIGKR